MKQQRNSCILFRGRRWNLSSDLYLPLLLLCCTINLNVTTPMIYNHFPCKVKDMIVINYLWYAYCKPLVTGISFTYYNDFRNNLLHASSRSTNTISDSREMLYVCLSWSRNYKFILSNIELVPNIHRGLIINEIIVCVISSFTTISVFNIDIQQPM